jgi:hypothetical protein
VTAAASPLGPAPTITASRLGRIFVSSSPARVGA